MGAFGCGFDPLVARTAQHLAPLGFAGFASLRFVLKALVGEKELFTRGENKLRAAVNALEGPIAVFHVPPRCPNRPSPTVLSARRYDSVLV